MGKLVEKLRQVGQGSGGGVGFLGSRQQSQPPRPAAIAVTIGASDSAAAEAAVANGADILIVAGWQAGADVAAVASAAGDKAVWGVEYAAEGRYADGTLKRAKESGASFAVLAQSTPAIALFEEVDGFDVVAQVEMPRDDLGLVLVRAENLLPLQAVMLGARISGADVARMTVAEFARFRLACEALRFPVLLPLADAPQDEHVKPLVRLGISGLVLQGAGVAPNTVGAQVRALREQLEKTPAKGEGEGGTVAIGGLMEANGVSPARREPKPAPEPDEE